MGREVLAAATDREGIEVVLAVNRDPSVDRVEGVAVEPAEDLADSLEAREPHVLVDFTGPGSVAEYARACAESGVGFVSGSTGLGDDDEAAMDESAGVVPVLHASNFSRGIAALRDAVADAAAALPAYDVEVVETHHAGKRDAPSGTANDLLDAVDEARDERAERVHGREGEAPRSDGEVGVHAVRAGTVTGEHVVVLAGNDEQVRLEHRAGARSAFAQGALDAAEWVADRDPGRYAFAEVIR